MKIRLVAVAILLIFIVVAGFYEYQRWNGPILHSTYALGDEIKDFPVSGMSLTFTNVVSSKTILTAGFQDIGGGVGSGEYVIVSVTIRNLGDNLIFSPKLSDYKFVLSSSDGNQINPDFLFWDSSNRSPVWDMGILVPNAQDITSLDSHQTLSGYLYFITGQGYTLNQLYCLKGVDTNPNFVVNLKS